MGGHALKQCVTRRILAEEFRDLENEVLKILRRKFPNHIVSPIRYFRNKADFGDLDVLFSTNSDKPVEINKELFETLFNSKEVVHNSNVWSFEYKEFQIDLITMPEEFMYSSAIYFGYNDLGNLMGRIAHKMGFKYGHKGLIYQYRTMDDHVAEEIILSSEDMEMIFAFMGYDFSRYMRGFESIEEIFEFTVSSKYFNKNIYLLDNRNYLSRTRDKKRKTYNIFLKWIKDREGLPEYPWPSMEERGGRKDTEEHLERAFKYFPNFKADYEKAKKKVEDYKAFKSLLNGDLVKGWTGLEGEKLGELMKYLRNFGDHSIQGSLQEYILSLNDGAKVEAFVKHIHHCMMGYQLASLPVKDKNGK